VGRERRDARAELLHHVDEVLAHLPGLARNPETDQLAFRYLQSSRGLGPAPAPLSPADQAKMSYAQAELMVGVTTKVLDELNLSDADFVRGIDIAMEALKAASAEGWSPL
jgi:hypothetical protein